MSDTKKTGIEAVRAELMGCGTQDVLNLAQAGELLQVGRNAILSMAAKGEIPARKVGRVWRFSRAALLAWLAGVDVKEA